MKAGLRDAEPGLLLGDLAGLYRGKVKRNVEGDIQVVREQIQGDVRENFDADERVQMNRKFEAAKKKVKVA